MHNSITVNKKGEKMNLGIRPIALQQLQTKNNNVKNQNVSFGMKMIYSEKQLTEALKSADAVDTIIIKNVKDSFDKINNENIHKIFEQKFSLKAFNRKAASEIYSDNYSVYDLIDGYENKQIPVEIKFFNNFYEQNALKFETPFISKNLHDPPIMTQNTIKSFEESKWCESTIYRHIENVANIMTDFYTKLKTNDLNFILKSRELND